MWRSLLFSLSVFCSTSLFAAPAAGPAKPTAGVFKPFTGKVMANKVRIRLKPDLESHILQQVNKNDLLLIVKEEGDFYAVEPPKHTKAYVFRSYILDGIVEANRVNIRLEPHIDAPVISQLCAGEKVEGQVCPLNHKWLEIAPPKGTLFYVSKEFIEQAGGAEFLDVMEKRKAQVEEFLNAAFLAAETECKKPYEEISFQTTEELFQNVLRNFADFPDAIHQAKEGITLFRETYLNKKVAYLEAKAELSPQAKEELLAKQREENQNLLADTTTPTDPDFLWSKRHRKQEMSDRCRFWDTVEESLYLSWMAFHSSKTEADFYAEQKANATVLTGTIEPYAQEVKDKPGDYILRGRDSPIAYLYSTQVELSQYEGKKVTLLVSSRPNHHFAFPAYFVLSIDSF